MNCRQRFAGARSTAVPWVLLLLGSALGCAPAETRDSPAAVAELSPLQQAAIAFEGAFAETQIRHDSIRRCHFTG
jgi:hypothetical protein